MRTVWKFGVTVDGKPHGVSMPEGAEIVHVAVEAVNEVVFWATVETEAAREQRAFRVVGTGQESGPFTAYRGTVVVPVGPIGYWDSKESPNSPHVPVWPARGPLTLPLVWHLFEVAL